MSPEINQATKQKENNWGLAKSNLFPKRTAYMGWGDRSLSLKLLQRQEHTPTLLVYILRVSIIQHLFFLIFKIYWSMLFLHQILSFLFLIYPFIFTLWGTFAPRNN